MTDAKFDTSWTNHDFSLTNLHMLENQILTDVIIYAGEEEIEIKAHKYMLASRSAVFYTMFCGSLPEKSGVIKVPDVDVDTINSLIRYMYTNACEINPKNVMAILYAAKKYGIETLEENCKTYLENEISVENVCVILDQAHNYDEKLLRNKCFEFVLRQAEEVFKSEGFLSLSTDMLCKILEDDNLRCPSEVDVYKACKLWAQERCRDENIDYGDDKNLRKVLEPVIHLIRFPIMGATSFAEFVSTENVLGGEEKVCVFQDIILCRNMSQFKSVERVPFRRDVVVCRSNEKVGGFLLHNGVSTDKLSFKVSKKAWLTKVGECLPVNRGCVCGKLEIFDSTKCLQTIEINLEYSEVEQTKYVTLPVAVELIPNETYKLKQTLNGVPTYEVTCGIKTIGTDLIDVEFVKHNDCKQFPTLWFQA